MKLQGNKVQCSGCSSSYLFILCSQGKVKKNEYCWLLMRHINTAFVSICIHSGDCEEQDINEPVNDASRDDKGNRYMNIDMNIMLSVT